ncbi:MAG: glycosyltransferase family 1 protein, partial [Acidobacteriota bacterium]
MDGLKVLHVLRAPVGGLFRHVTDLARAQIARGFRVGIIADSTTGGARADEVFRDLQPRLDLGLMRIPMPRHPGLSDAGAALRVRRR